MAELKSYRPTPRDMISQFLSRQFGDGYLANKQSNKFMGLLDYTPVGALTDSYEAGKMMGSGDIAMGAGLLGAAALPIPANKMMKLWHGSPYKFNKMSTDKINTGEGTQQEGWGLYTAEERDVAKYYQDTIIRDEYDPELIFPKKGENKVAAKYYNEYLMLNAADNDMPVKNVPEYAIESLEQMKEAKKRGISPDDLNEFVDEAFDFGMDEEQEELYRLAYRDDLNLDEIIKEFKDKSDEFIASMPRGNMYELEVSADPSEFFDLDEPISNAPEAVKEWIARNPMDSHNKILTGHDVVHSARRSGKDRELSEFLSNKGLKGNKYYDQQSRMDKDGTRNYVIFRDEIIKVVKRYGIAAAASLMGMDQMDMIKIITTEPENASTR